jgi:hypothetical protein
VIGPAVTAHRRDFVVDLPAKMLRRNQHLSKNARRLYGAMRALADGRTGELRIGDRWLHAEAIDAAAEMCRDIRMRCMRELVAAGLVSFERERVHRKVRGRFREVLGRSRYVVHRSPMELSREGFVPVQGKARVLLQSISSNVEEIGSQVFSETPSQVSEKVDESSSRASPAKADDDSLPRPDFEAIDLRNEEVRAEASRSLRAKGWPGHVVDAGLQYIAERVDHSGVAPNSPQYYVAGFERAMSYERDRKLIETRASRRARFMGVDSEALRRVAEDIEHEARISGRPVRAVVEARVCSSAGIAADGQR